MLTKDIFLLSKHIKDNDLLFGNIVITYKLDKSTFDMLKHDVMKYGYGNINDISDNFDIVINEVKFNIRLV